MTTRVRTRHERLKAVIDEAAGLQRSLQTPEFRFGEGRKHIDLPSVELLSLKAPCRCACGLSFVVLVRPPQLRRSKIPRNGTGTDIEPPCSPC
jgi:hypothetical protein